RGASLVSGFVEECGLRCPSHGWKYGAKGPCLEQPFEPAGSTYKDRIRQRAYPVERLAGILFVYMGPPPAPLLPRWDVLAWEDGQRRLERREGLEGNWLQGVEDTGDLTPTFFLHGYMLYQKGVRGRQVEQYYRPYERYGYQRFEWGVLKSWRYAGGGTELGPEHSAGAPLIFPNILRVVQPPWHTLHWRVPIDDTRTTVIWAGFQRGVAPASKEGLENPPIVDIPPQKH